MEGNKQAISNDELLTMTNKAIALKMIAVIAINDEKDIKDVIEIASIMKDVSLQYEAARKLGGYCDIAF